MDTKLDWVVVEEYQVIGHGTMIDRPCQIGEWWCVPLEMYDKALPPEAEEKMNQILKTETIAGFIVADDIRNVNIEKPQIGVNWEKILTTIVAGVLLVIAGAVLLYVLIPLILVGLCLAGIMYDPILIAVTEDGRWLHLLTWYE